MQALNYLKSAEVVIGAKDSLADYTREQMRNGTVNAVIISEYPHAAAVLTMVFMSDYSLGLMLLDTMEGHMTLIPITDAASFTAFMDDVSINQTQFINQTAEALSGQFTQDDIIHRLFNLYQPYKVH